MWNNILIISVVIAVFLVLFFAFLSPYYLFKRSQKKEKVSDPEPEIQPEIQYVRMSWWSGVGYVLLFGVGLAIFLLYLIGGEVGIEFGIIELAIMLWALYFSHSKLKQIKIVRNVEGFGFSLMKKAEEKPKQRNLGEGFIQIPVLLLIVAGILTVSTGGYYVTQKTEIKNSEGLSFADKIEPAEQPKDVSQDTKEKVGFRVLKENTDTRKSLNKIDTQGSVENLSEKLLPDVKADQGAISYIEFSEKIKEKYPEYKHIDNWKLAKQMIEEYPVYKDRVTFDISPKNTAKIYSPKTDTDLQGYIEKADEKILTLEIAKQNFYLLESAIDEHTEKSIDHATNVMGMWVNFAEETVNKVPYEYQGIVGSTRDSIVSGRDYLAQSIENLYSFLDLYFWNSYENATEIQVILERQDFLSACIELWNSGENDLGCEIAVMAKVDDYKDDFVKIVGRLQEFDVRALEMIDRYTKSAEENISQDLESISRTTNILQTFQAELDGVSQQLYQQDYQSQTQTKVGSLSCEYPVDDYILVPGEGWKSVKKCSDGTYIESDKYVTDTSNMSAQQICDMKKAARYSGGAFIVDSQQDEC